MQRELLAKLDTTAKALARERAPEANVEQAPKLQADLSSESRLLQEVIGLCFHGSVVSKCCFPEANFCFPEATLVLS